VAQASNATARSLRALSAAARRITRRKDDPRRFASRRFQQDVRILRRTADLLCLEPSCDGQYDYLRRIFRAEVIASPGGYISPEVGVFLLGHCDCDEAVVQRQVLTSVAGWIITLCPDCYSHPIICTRKFHASLLDSIFSGTTLVVGGGRVLLYTRNRN